MTSTLETAISYAYRSFVFGEMGETVWEMYQGMKALNLDTWKPSPEIRATFDKIERLATEEHFPIVYMLNSFDYEKLLTDGGEPIPEGSLEFQHCSRHVDEYLYLDPNDRYHTIYLRPWDQIVQFVNQRNTTV